MADSRQSVRFDIIGNDRASEAFSRAGRAAAAMGGEMGDAAAKSAFLDDALKRQRETSKRSADATLVLAKTDKILGDAMLVLAADAHLAADELAEVRREADRLNGKTVDVKIDVDRSAWSRLGTLLGHGAGGIGGAGLGGITALGSLGGRGISSGLGALPLAGGNPWLGAGVIGAATASAPFLGQLAGGGIIAALGGGLAALGIAGALITPKMTGAKVSVLQLTAAQDRLNASQDRLNALQKSGKATASQLAAAQASVASAQDQLNKLQKADATQKNFAAIYAQQLKVQAAFGTLKNHATDSLATIGRSFTPVLLAIAQTANDVLGTLTPVFAGAVKTVSGPFREFADVLIRTLARPDVKNSIQDVAKAFSAILTAVTPALGSTIGNVAVGISKIAKAISANPQVFASFTQFLGMIAGGALTAIAWLTKVASYIEAHFAPAMHRVAVIFDGVRHEIAHVWDQIWNNSVGSVIRIGHNVETQWNSWTHGVAVIFDGFRHDIAHYWDMIFNNTIGRVQRGFHDIAHWFDVGRHQIAAVFDKSRTWLLQAGKDVIQGLWDGLGFIWNKVAGWVGRIAGWIKNLKGPISLDRKLLEPEGRAIMEGLLHGLLGGFGKVTAVVSGMGSTLGAQVGAVAAGAFGPAQRYAASLLGAYGWGPSQWAPLLALWQRESGWNPYAVNPSSGAYGIPQALPAAWGHPYNLGDWAAQVRWGLGYISGRWGSPAAAWAHEVAAGWYGSGLDAMFSSPTLIGVGERGPERVTVTPAGRSAGNTYNINVYVAPGADADTGRRIVAAIRQHEKRSGAGWRK